MPKRFKIGILGSGQIAQGFDRPGDTVVLSMANAIHQTPAFEIGGFFDLEPARAISAEERWNVAATPRDRVAWFAQSWDIIYIATPNAQHAQDMAQAIAARPQAIIVEKPLALDSEAGEALLEKAAGQMIPVIINFPRRFHTAIPKLRERLESLSFVTPSSAVCAYSGGLAHNAVHLIDLFGELWGDDWQVQASDVQSVPFTLTLKRGENQFSWSFLEPSIAKNYLLEMRVYGHHGIVEIAHSPEFLSFSAPAPHPHYHNFSVYQDVIQYPIEAEPLLCHELDYVAGLLSNPKEAEAHMLREQQRHRFIGRFLDLAPSLAKEAAAWNR